MPKQTRRYKHFKPYSRRWSPLRLVNFILAFAITGVLYLVFSQAAPTPGMYGTWEQDQVNKINSARAANGKGSLQHIECLNTIAENWNKNIATTPVKNAEGQITGYGVIKHNPNLGSEVTSTCGGYWTKLAENVGASDNSANMFNTFMSSDAHKANILDSTVTKVGVGAYYNSEGELWVTHVFASCSTCTSPWSTNATLPADPNASGLPSSWGGWEDLGGGMQSGNGPTVSSWASNRLDVFIRGGDNALWHRGFSGSWRAWENLGGSLASAPGAVSWGSGRIDVFAKSSKNTLLHKWYTNSTWSGWEDLGGNITSAPTAASWASGRLDVFARGADGALWHIAYNGKWNPWESLGGGIVGPPGAVSWGSNRIDVFARGTNNALYQKYYNGKWSGWVKLGGGMTSGPTVSSWASGRLDVFFRGGDNALWHRWFNGSWSGWEKMGGTLTAEPGAVSWGPNRIDVFGRSNTGSLNHVWYPRN